jgi:hypothetical protein
MPIPQGDAAEPWSPPAIAHGDSAGSRRTAARRWVAFGAVLIIALVASIVAMTSGGAGDKPPVAIAPPAVARTPQPPKVQSGREPLPQTVAPVQTAERVVTAEESQPIFAEPTVTDEQQPVPKTSAPVPPKASTSRRKLAPTAPGPGISGLFSARGTRFEFRTVIAPFDTDDGYRERCKTINGWKEQALNARSASMRDAATNAILQIVVAHAEQQQQLSANELQECRSAAVSLLTSKDDNARLFGTWALKDIGDADSRKGLMVALKDRDPAVRLGAANAIATVGDDSCISALVLAVSKIDPHVAKASVRAISRIGTPAAKKSLEGLLKNASDQQIKDAIEVGLDYIDGHRP